MATERSHTKTPWLVWLIAGAILLIAIIGVSTSALYFNTMDPRQAAPAGGATVTDVVQNSNTFMGQTTTVTGQVAERISPQALRLSSGAPGGEQSLLALAPRPEIFPADLAPNETVHVTGTIRRFVLTEVEAEMGTDLNDDQYAIFEGLPFIMAQSLSGGAPAGS